jgi:flagellar biosynthetic protein FlhB
MSDRTESATPYRRREARRKGQVAKSVEVNSAVIMLATFWLLTITVPLSYQAITTLMKQTFNGLSTIDITLTALKSQGLVIAGLLVQATAPLALSLLVIGVVANLGQVGLLLSPQALQPDFNKVNPLNGFKRLFSPRGLVELFKSLAKVGLIGFVVYLTLRDNYINIMATANMSVYSSISTLSQIGLSIGRQAGWAMLVIAIIDFFYQRYEFEKNLKMTKQEVREEMKRFENPFLKSRIRARQRQMAMSRMMAAVPKADVVITNPTHFAIALRYDKSKMHAPEVVAKGERLVAQRIKELAREHKIPLYEDKPLARNLFKTAEVGQIIPTELYQAGAQVLAFVYRLKAQYR